MQGAYHLCGRCRKTTYQTIHRVNPKLVIYTCRAPECGHAHRLFMAA